MLGAGAAATATGATATGSAVVTASCGALQAGAGAGRSLTGDGGDTGACTYPAAAPGLSGGAGRARNRSLAIARSSLPICLRSNDDCRRSSALSAACGAGARWPVTAGLVGALAAVAIELMVAAAPVRAPVAATQVTTIREGRFIGIPCSKGRDPRTSLRRLIALSAAGEEHPFSPPRRSDEMSDRCSRPNPEIR